MRMVEAGRPPHFHDTRFHARKALALQPPGKLGRDEVVVFPTVSLHHPVRRWLVKLVYHLQDPVPDLAPLREDLVQLFSEPVGFGIGLLELLGELRMLPLE